MTTACPRVTNEVEIRLIGLQRSGNHAIAQWLTAQHGRGATCFLNSVRHGAVDPFASAGAVVTTGLPEGLDREHLRTSAKALLLYSYEDETQKVMTGHSVVESLLMGGPGPERDQWLGRSVESFEAIVIRDPYNFLASRIRAGARLTGEVDPVRVMEAWKQLATVVAESLDSAADGDHLIVNYNEWFADRDYRRRLSARVRGRFTDQSMEAVPLFGGGSSFDPTALPRTPLSLVLRRPYKALRPTNLRLIAAVARNRLAGARSMAVMDRWREYENDRRFRELASDRETAALATELFGHLEGVSEPIARFGPGTTPSSGGRS